MATIGNRSRSGLSQARRLAMTMPQEIAVLFQRQASDRQAASDTMATVNGQLSQLDQRVGTIEQGTDEP